MFPHTICPNFTCVFPLCQSIFMHNIYLGCETNWCGERSNSEVNYFWIHIHFTEKDNTVRDWTMLCHNWLISMRTHKAHATRWPASGHLPPALKKAYIKCALHFMTSQLPDHLYISKRILFNKGTHASVSKNLISVMIHVMTYTLKKSAKYAQQSMILAYQIFCVPNPWSSQGLHDSLLPSISKHLEKFTMLTDQIIHTLKN